MVYMEATPTTNQRPLTYSVVMGYANGYDPDYPPGSFEEALAEWLEMTEEQ